MLLHWALDVVQRIKIIIVKKKNETLTPVVYCTVNIVYFLRQKNLNLIHFTETHQVYILPYIGCTAVTLKRSEKIVCRSRGQNIPIYHPF